MLSLENIQFGIKYIFIPAILIAIIVVITIQSVNKNEKFKNENRKFTIVICNYSRPWNIEKSLLKLTKNFPNAEIIISHGNPKTFKEFKNCINIKEFDNTYGATSRFFSAKHSSYNNILFLDDDMIPSSELVKSLLNYVENNPISISGPINRKCDKNGYYNKNITNYNIILTPCLMTSKTLLENYLLNFNKYSYFLKSSKGNGEDLSFNHNLYINFNKNPVYIKGKYERLDEKNGYSAKTDHYEVRNNFCKKFY